jgi:hypothetical protein
LFRDKSLLNKNIGVASMNSTTSKIMKIITTVTIVAAASFFQPALASEHEAACKEHIQGKIAWDPTSNYASAQKWEDKNLNYLCGGTTVAKAPGECFHGVMTGHVSYGTSDKWEYKNAIELCAGTSDAEKTINCFKGKIANKVDWEEAIKQCQAPKNVKNVAE